MKPRLLFLSPTVPALSGHGGAMRAGVFLEAFSTIYTVSLVVLHLWERKPFEGAALTDHCASVQEFSLADVEAAHGLEKLIRVHWEDFDHVHLFRLSMTGFVRDQLKSTRPAWPRYTLDLDDYESRLTRRTAELHAAAGELSLSRAFLRRAAQQEARESEVLPKFDQVYVCHQADCEAIGRRYGCANLHAVPNSVRVPAMPPEMPCGGTLVFLFVGTLDYFPNEDGLSWFCTEVLPLIHLKTSVPFRLSIAGSRPPKRILELAGLQDVTITSNPISLAPFYAESSICIAPIRVGAGTRIKILEAMSYQRAVVSTRIGAEGLDVSHGRELLIGDTAEEFSELCVSLMRDEALRLRLAVAGAEWVRRNHSSEVVAQSIGNLAHALLPAPVVSSSGPGA